MHILWYGKLSPFCGNVTYCREITGALARRGHQLSFAHFGSEASDYPTLNLPYWYKNQMLTLAPKAAREQVKTFLQQDRPDILHASLTIAPLDWQLPHLSDVPCVGTFHPAFDRRLSISSLFQRFTYQMYAPHLRHYAATIVFSELQKQLLLACGLPAARVEVIANGVDPDLYCPGSPVQIAATKAEFAATQIVIYQGRLSPEKNLAALLQAWQLAQRPADCKLLIMGDGSLATQLQREFKDPSIVWLGFVRDRERRIQLLQAADIFVLPSLVEGLSLALLEAMACQTAVIATDVGADGEVINQEAGIGLEPRQVARQLVPILEQLSHDPARVQTLAQRARQRVLERYTLARNLDQLEALYQRLV